MKEVEERLLRIFVGVMVTFPAFLDFRFGHAAIAASRCLENVEKRKFLSPL